MISLKEVIKICELIFPDYAIASGNISCTVYDREGTIIAQFIELVDSQIQGRLFLTGHCKEVSQRLREVFTTTCKDGAHVYSFFILQGLNNVFKFT